MSDKNFYEILGVRPDASQAEIRAAYLKLAKQWHPDLNTGNKAEAEQRFKEIAYAYDVLSNADKRAAYDAASEQSSGFESTMDEADAFDLFISVLLDLAFELAENGADQITIYQALNDMGCPSGTAKTLAQKAHKLGGKSYPGKSNGKSARTKVKSSRENGGKGETTTATASVANEPDETFPAGPWSRWFARSLDLLVGATVASPLIGWLFQWLWALEPAPLRLAAYVFLVAPIPFIVDAIIVGVFGNSLGKALLKIRVVTMSTVAGKVTLKPIEFSDAMSRNLELWIKGFWGGIPFVAAVPQFLAYVKVSEHKKVPWDNAGRHLYNDLDFPDLEVIRQRAKWEMIAAFVVCAFAVPIIGKLGAEIFLGQTESTSESSAEESTDVAEQKNSVQKINRPTNKILPLNEIKGSFENDYLLVTFHSHPSGARIVIDGTDLGNSPVSVNYPFSKDDEKTGFLNTPGGYAVFKDGTSEHFSEFSMPIKKRKKSLYLFTPIGKDLAPEERFWAELDLMAPNWRQVNTEPNFLNWLKKLDPITNRSRQEGLDNAQNSLDSGSVADYFIEWSG